MRAIQLILIQNRLDKWLHYKNSIKYMKDEYDGSDLNQF